MNRISKVRQFHRIYNLPVENRPNISNKETNELRIKLLEEELEELKESLNNQDQVGVLDALVDLEYVLLGAIISLGYAGIFNRAFHEIHRSNLSKLGADGNPLHREDGKVIKGPNFKEPNLEKFFEGRNGQE